MAKPIPTTQYQQVVDAVARTVDGASLEQIEAQLPDPPTRRTLQRWLGDLMAQQRLHKTGLGRATRYWPMIAEPLPNPAPASAPVAYAVHGGAQHHVLARETQAPTRIALSAQAQAIEAHVRQPIQMRTPVGYDRAFLDNYRPNVSFYLPKATCAELLAQGQATQTHEPAGTYARSIANRLLIDLSWNSSRLEGNTYSLLETERLLSAGQAAQGKDTLEAQMILNHKEAIEFLITSAPDIGFDRYTVLNLHGLLSDNLLQDPGASGRLRTIAVGIGQTVFHPLEGPQRIEECFDQVLDTAAAINDPFEQAFFVMVHLPYLQPFEDVNKRVARLAGNIGFIRQNLCPLSFVDVAQHTYISAMLGIYELNRVELLRDVFVWAYKRSCARYSAVRQSLGEPDVFRMQYRAQIVQAVAEVVRAGLNKTQAVALLRQTAQSQVPPADQARFLEVTETQLMSLHEGSIARYRLRPSEYRAWKATWQ